jgi:hypothetical protein
MLRVEKLITDPIMPANYQAESRLEWDIPVGDVFIELMLRVSGTMTIAVDACTGLQVGGMERILRELRLTADWNLPDAPDSLLRSYTSRGVNDGVAGRTASYAGRMLAFENLIDVGAPVVITDPGLAIAAQPVEIAFPLRFWTPRSARPMATLLDTRLMTSLKLEVRPGILDTTAAGDDTDVLVTDATSTVVSDLDWQLSAAVVKNPQEVGRYDLRRVRSLTKALEVNNALQLDLGERRFYRRLLMMQTDDDVLSDVRATQIKVKIDKYTNVIDRRWGELQAEAKQRYSLAAALAGQNVVDFQGLLNTLQANNVDLEMNVPAGAAVADDRMFVAAEDVVLAARAGVPRVSQGRGRR